LSWQIIESVVADEFDVVSCQEMKVDHGFCVPMQLLWPDREQRGDRQVRAIPVCINTVQHPLPTPARCYRYGQAIGRAIEAFDEELKLVVLGTGGLSPDFPVWSGKNVGGTTLYWTASALRRPEEHLHAAGTSATSTIAR